MRRWVKSVKPCGLHHTAPSFNCCKFDTDPPLEPLEEFEFSDTDPDHETMKYLEDPEERIILDDIQKGSVYEIDCKKLPPTTPKVLRESVRVVLVTDKTEKSLMIRYPTKTQEKTICCEDSFDPLPKMDRFEMDSELAVKALAQRIPVDELNRKAFRKTFWFVGRVETEKGSRPSIEEFDSEDIELKNGTCYSKDLCLGRSLRKKRTVKCVKKFKESGNKGHHISDSLGDVKVAKLNPNCTEQGKIGGLISSNREPTIGYQVSHDFDAEKAEEEMLREKDQTLTCVEKFEENGDDGHILNSPSDVEMVKLKYNYTEQRKLERHIFSNAKQKNGYQVSHDFDADKAKGEMQSEKDQTVKCVEKFEENDGDYISGSPIEAKEVKLELQEFNSTGNSTEEGKRVRDYMKVEQKNGHRVCSPEFDADKTDGEMQMEKDEEFHAVSSRSRKRMKTCGDIKTRKAQKLGGGKMRAGAPKAATKKMDPDVGRWSIRRYEKARCDLLEVMISKNAVFGNEIRRQDLRNEALKRIGDTGLLDHLLKHARDKVTPDGKHRFRRWYDRDGIMEFWLESADLVDLRKELGIRDPYWIPPAGWKKPGDSTNIQKSICAATIRVLKEDLAREMRKMRTLEDLEDDDLSNPLIWNL